MWTWGGNSLPSKVITRALCSGLTSSAILSHRDILVSGACASSRVTRGKLRFSSLAYLSSSSSSWCCVWSCLPSINITWPDPDLIRTSTVTLASSRTTARIRRAYLSAILAQDSVYFETTGPGEVASRMVRDIGLVQSAVGEKLGQHLTMALRSRQTTADLAYAQGLSSGPRLLLSRE